MFMLSQREWGFLVLLTDGTAMWSSHGPYGIPVVFESLREAQQAAARWDKNMNVQIVSAAQLWFPEIKC